MNLELADPDGPHRLPLSEQKRRHVVDGRRLGDSTEVCTVVIIWDRARRHWVFYLHGSSSLAACFTPADVEAAAHHVLSARTAPP